MKKRLLVAMLAMSMVMSLTACGTKTENSDATGQEQADTSANTGDKTTLSTKDFDVESLVTIGDYENMEVMADTYTFSDADVDTKLKSDFESYIAYTDGYAYTKLDKDTIETGDLVNLDYCGKKDGVAFDGGTAQGAHLEIGSNTFIEGFEDGMIGHKVGESFDIPLTFPTEYHSEELAGQDVVFEITVNSIDEKKMPEMTDEMIAGMGNEYQNISEFREYEKNNLQSACDAQNQSAKETAVWEAVFTACEVKEAPQELIDDSKERIQKNTESYAGYYGISVEEFVAQNMQTTMEAYTKQTEESAVVSAKEKVVMAAIAKKAGIELSDADVYTVAEEEYAGYGYESVEAMFADVGSGPYYDYVLQKKVNDYLVSVVKVIENDPVSIMSLVNN